MNHLLTRADDRLRTFLLEAPGRVLLLLLDVCAVVAFALVLMTRSLGQLAGAGPGVRVLTVLMLCAPLCIMLAFAQRAGRGMSLLGHACLAGVCTMGMLLRVCFLDHVSSDYEIYLSDWLQRLAAGSFGDGMRASIGEYNVLYQYILFAITRLPVPALYAVKAVSFLGDAFLAGAAASLAGEEEHRGALALCAVLLLPTCALDGGMFAQCDSLYAACALWGLALALRGKPAGSAACFALSLAFKLQAVFLLPIVAVLWAAGRLRLSDALVFLGTLVLTALPALLGGKGVGQILAIYMGQTGLYTGLTYNAPTLFGLMNTAGLNVYAYGSFGIALAMGALLAMLAFALPRARRMDAEDFLRTALLMVLLVVFCLPRMHERYFFLAGALAVALAARSRRALPAAVLIELASLSTVLDLGIPLRDTSVMMLAAIVLTAFDAKRACEAQKSCV